MSAYDRVLALLKRLSPSWPSTDSDTSVGKELGSIAVALGMAADVVDTALDEIFPDTTTQLIERWEKITRVPTRTSDDINTRRSKVLAVLRRSSGARLDQLEKMLATLLDLDVTDIIFIEVLRQFIEEALTETTGVIASAVPISPSNLTVRLGKPWPGVVDDFGVKVYVELSGIGTTVATLTSPTGTIWTIPVNATSGWYQTRTVFEDEPAGGLWVLNIHDSSAPTLTNFQLLVSNDVDSGQIFNFYALRDPAIAGTPDLVEAQRIFHRTALGNMKSFIIESMVAVVDDVHSLVDRDLVGV